MAEKPKAPEKFQWKEGDIEWLVTPEQARKEELKSKVREKLKAKRRGDKPSAD